MKATTFRFTQIDGYYGDEQTWCKRCAGERYGRYANGSVKPMDLSGQWLRPITEMDTDIQPRCDGCGFTF